MSSGEKRAIVARGVHTYVAAAADADCRRFAAPFLARDAKNYGGAGGAPLELTRYGHGAVVVRSGGQAVLGMSADGDDWQVDQLAADKEGFIEGCQAVTAGRFSRGICGCEFDELRGRGYESEKQLVKIAEALRAGSQPDDLVASVQACAPSGP